MNRPTKHYQWAEGSTITRIDIREQKDGRAVAYIYANAAEDARPARQNIRAALRQKGWGTLSDHRGDQFALRVSGLANGDELLTLLRAQGFVQGEPTVTTHAVEGAKSESPLAFIKNNSLRLSAVIYAIGDLLYFKGSDNKFDKGMALSFGFGDSMLAILGGRDDNRQFKSLLGEYKNHLEASGIEIPKNASIHMETAKQDRGLFGNALEFLRANINSIKIMSEVVGGAFVLRSGLKKTDGKRNPFNIVSGVVIMAGWAGALLVKEKKPDRAEQQPQGLLESAGTYIQEKPLRLAGYAGLTFNALKITDAVLNRRPTSNWNIGAVSAMVGANTLYSISDKTVGGDIKIQEMVSDVYSIAAQILNKQPDAVRDHAIDITAKFLGERAEIKDTHHEIMVRLKQEMAIQRQNPWFETTPLAPYQPTPKKGVHKEAAPVANDNVSHANDAPRPVIRTEELQRHGSALAAAAAGRV